MSGTGEAPQSTPVELPAPTGTDLSNQRHLNSYLARIAGLLQEHTSAHLVGIYLLDRVTGRLGLRAWALADRSTHSAGGTVPAELGRRGIEGEDLTAATLRDYIHAAPRGQRIAMPVHDGEHWRGSIVGLATHAFSEDAPTSIHDAAAQLAAILGTAESLVVENRIEETEEAIDLPSDAILGTATGGGVTSGPAMLYRSGPVRGTSVGKVEEDREQALARFDQALAATDRQIEQLLQDAKSDLYDVVSLIFSTHLLMLRDEAFSGAIRQLVEAGQTPEDAVQSVVASYVRTFRGLRETRLAEKAQDVLDIGQRLLENLAADVRREDEQVAGHIAILQDVLPSDLVRLAMSQASGVVLLGSTVTAHISILAQSLDLPVIFTDDRRILEIAPQTPLLLDADEGALLISPTSEQLLEHGAGRPATTTAVRALSDDDATAAGGSTGAVRATRVYANVNLLSDARRGARMGAEGIGLYRSEFPFIVRNDYVSEEEQYLVYKTIIESMDGRPVTLRTADIGGDKLLAGREEERNPFLGVRGIRFSLANRDLFREQLRAMLRAGYGTDLRIMFPMVSSVEEVEDAREELELCTQELRTRGIPHHESPQIGAMIELPSAVVSIEDLAEACDFLSIGTNDLIMYLLAVDRTNERLSELYRSHHPVVVRTIADIARRVGDQIDALSVCGEAAADPLMIPFFTGIGIGRLSVAPNRIERVRTELKRTPREEAESYANEMLAIRSLRQMDEFLTERAARSANLTSSTSVAPER